MHKKKKFKSHENGCINFVYCCMAMPKADNKIRKCNQDKKSLKTSFNIYDETESLLEKNHLCNNNPEEFSITTLTKHAM